MASIACPLCRNNSHSSVDHLLNNFIQFLQNPLQCPLCAFSAPSRADLHQHLIGHCAAPTSDDVPLKHQCKQCNVYRTDDSEDFKRHMEAEHPERKFICPHCCKSFKVQASLRLHVKMTHEKGHAVHQCQFCHKKFTTNHRKEIHEKRHEQQQQQQQQHPTQKESSSTAMETSPTEEPKTFTCPFCDKSFKKDQYLQQHIRTHEAKKWECNVCHKLFTTKEYLRKHARLHTGETPYSCDLCSKTFTFQQSYHKHVLYHSDERPYCCDQCGRRFKELSTLHNHQRIHTGEKPYSCDTCGKSFRQRVSFVVHRRIHTGALPYACSACGKSFRYKVSQRTHKCEINEPEDADVNSSVIRNRSTWLERLVQQTATMSTTNATTDATNTDDVTQPEPQAATAANNENQCSVFDPKTYYETDGLPSFDLSQLALNFDSELIFPS